MISTMDGCRIRLRWTLFPLVLAAAGSVAAETPLAPFLDSTASIATIR